MIPNSSTSCLQWVLMQIVIEKLLGGIQLLSVRKEESATVSPFVSETLYPLALCQIKILLSKRTKACEKHISIDEGMSH